VGTARIELAILIFFNAYIYNFFSKFNYVYLHLGEITW